MQMGMASQLCFTAIITLMKVAILLTYLRKLPRPHEPARDFIARTLTTRQGSSPRS